MTYVFEPGTKVSLVGSTRLAIISRVMLLGHQYVDYEVIWWDGSTRHCEWLHSFEVEWCDGERQQIGFRVAE